MEKSSISQDFGMQEYFIWGVMSTWLIALLYTSFFKTAVTFLKVDMLMNFLYGLPWFFVPAAMVASLEIGISTPSPDAGHYYLAILTGIVLLYVVSVVWVCHDTTDKGVTSAILWTGITRGILFLVSESFVFGQNRNKIGKINKWTSMDITHYMCVAMIVAWVVGAVNQLRKLDQCGSYTQRFTRLNIHLHIDYILTFIIGFGHVAFTEWAFKFTKMNGKTDEVHAHLARCIGICYLFSALITGKAINFSSDAIKIKLFFCRIGLMVAHFGSFLVILHLADQLMWRLLPAYIGPMGVYFINAVAGYLCNPGSNPAKRQ